MTAREILVIPRAKEFLDAKAVGSKNTANTYSKALYYFNNYLVEKENQTLDSVIDQLLNRKIDVYKLLQGAIYYFIAIPKPKLSTRTIHGYVAAVKSYLQHFDVDIIPRKFKNRVTMPTIEEEDEEELEPKDIRQILLSTNSRRLKAYLCALGSGGFRALEACAIRNCDIDFSESPTKVHVRREYSKRKRARDVYISDEATRFVKEWLEWKYRKKGSAYRTFVKGDNDLVFTPYGTTEINGKPIRPKGLYNRLRQEFVKVLSAVKLDAKKEGMKRGKITLHSFRRTVYTTISNNFGNDYADGFLGHKKTTYHTLKEEKRRQIYANDCMPHLTYLDYTEVDKTLNKQQTKLDEKDEEINQLKQQIANLGTKFDNLLTRFSEISAVRDIGESPFTNKQDYVKYHKEVLKRLANEKKPIPKYEEMR